MVRHGVAAPVSSAGGSPGDQKKTTEKAEKQKDKKGKLHGKKGKKYKKCKKVTLQGQAQKKTLEQRIADLMEKQKFEDLEKKTVHERISDLFAGVE